MLVGGSASGESGVSVNGKSHTVVGLGNGVAGAGLPPVLPTITYSTSVAQVLTYRNVSVSLVHSGATAGLTTVYFDKCPSATLTAGGDATTVYCSGDRSCSFSGSGGAAKFRGINLGAYTANGSNPIEVDGCNVTGSLTSSTSISLMGACSFGAGVSITAPLILTDPVSREKARAAGVTFAAEPTVPVTWGSPVDIDTTAADGTAQTFARSDHKHRLTFGVVAAVLALATSAINVNGQRITGGATPISSTDYVTKGYADGLAVGLKVKTAAVVVATSNQATLSGLAQTIDGVALNTVGQRVLLTGQTTASQNGLWVVQSGAWTRPADFATGSSAAQSYVPITGGSWAGGSYFCTSSVGSDVVDTNSLTWTVFSQPVSVTAGAGLTKTGTTLDVVANADGTIIVNADDVQVGTLLTSNLGANIVTSAKFRKSAGLSVVGNSGATLSDVADITGTNNTALRVSSGVLGFGTLDLSTALFVGTLPTARQAAQAHGSLTGLSGDDHTQYILVAGTRAFAGDQSMGTHGLTNTGFVASQGSPSSTGFLRYPNATGGFAKMKDHLGNDLTVIDGIDGSDVLRFGDPSRLAGMYWDTKTGGFFGWWVNSVNELLLDSTKLDLLHNNVVNVGYLDFYDGTNAVATGGMLRAWSGATILGVLDGASSISLLKYGVSTAHTFTLGDNSAVTEIEYRAATSGGVHSFVIANGLEAQLDATKFDLKNNDLVMGTGGITHGASPASVGADRWSHGNFSAGKSSGGSDRNLVSWGVDGTDWLTFGHPSNAADFYTTGGSHIFNVASATKLSVDANKLFIGNTGTAPTSNPAGGLYMWVAAAESLRTRSDASVEEHLTHLNGGSISGTTKQIIRRENNLTTFNGSRTVIDAFTLPDNTIALFEARVVGRNATTAEQAAYYVRRGAFRRGGAATLLNNDVTDPWESNNLWDASFDVSSNDVRINVLGAVGQTIVWWVRWEITLFTP